MAPKGAVENDRKMHAGMKPHFTMPHGLLRHVPVFVAVAEQRSFTAGARLLGISASAASQAVARMERAIGTALFVRTSRNVRLTPAGDRLLSVASESISAMAGALEVLEAGRHEPTGVLRLNVVRTACEVGLPPVLAELARRHPAIRTEVVVENRPIDIVGEGFDAGVRLKQSVRADMVRVRLSGPLRIVVVGSPAYLRSHGRPRHPRDLIRHACLGWRSASGVERRWAFREGEVAAPGPVIADDAAMLIACAERDLGLAYVAEVEARRSIEAGRLETVLDAHAVVHDGLYLYFPRAAREMANMRALVSCVRALSGASGR